MLQPPQSKLCGFLATFAIIAILVAAPAPACTTAVISGKATVDGRPILWKNRDTTASAHNEVIALRDGRYQALAVVNAGERKSIWMGMNEAGLCIQNAVSRNLATKDKQSGPGNGQFMRLALETCATVAEFEELLERTNRSGRTTLANIGVIDAQGGAAMFEVGPQRFVKFDANDPAVAPRGYIVRANFSTSASDLPTHPTAEQLQGVYSAERYLRAHELLQSQEQGQIQVEFVLRNLTRDLADQQGRPHAGTVNGSQHPLPPTIATDNTISRTRTRSAVVFHGVRPGESAALSTMWTILGDPKFSIAVPAWAQCDKIAEPLASELGGEIGEIAITLRDWNLTSSGNAVATAGLPGIWEDLWKLEDQLLRETLQAKDRWSRESVVAADIQTHHQTAADRALAAMQRELAEAKAAALGGETTLAKRVIRVAIYDHSEGTSSGPTNLLRFLTTEQGFACTTLSPAEIRAGELADFDVLIVPGGSGSKQAEMLQPSGREAIRDFVAQGKGYVGICAGSYLASSQYEWSLHLINARVWDRTHWARGVGTVKLALSKSGVAAFDAEAAEVDVHYAQGPLLVPGNHPELPAYEMLAHYATEVAKKGAPTGAMVDTHAIVRGKYQQGRVICFSPHPEINNGPNWLMAAGVRWAAGAGE